MLKEPFIACLIIVAGLIPPRHLFSAPVKYQGQTVASI